MTIRIVVHGMEVSVPQDERERGVFQAKIAQVVEREKAAQIAQMNERAKAAEEEDEDDERPVWRTFSSMIGVTMTDVTVNRDEDEMVFTSTEGKTFRFYHVQDCCECVNIEDVCGDLADLVGSPLLMAEEVCSSKRGETWTFYKFATLKGSVTVRWLGSSNGYYSESVDFEERAAS